MNQKNNLLILSVLAFLFVFGNLNAQYVRQYQAIYPYNQATVFTKVNAMVASPQTSSYVVCTNPKIHTSVTGLGFIMLNNDLEVVNNREFQSGNYRTAHFTTMDAAKANDGGMVAVGSIYCAGSTKAFVAKFASNGSAQWMYTYPDATVFNGIAVYPTTNTNPQFVVCGSKTNNGHTSAIAMGLSDMGYPVWGRVPITTSNYQSAYNDILIFKNQSGITGDFEFGLTGWVDRNLASAEREVMVTNMSRMGTVLFSKYYRHQLMAFGDDFFEEGMGICVDDWGKYIYVTGPASNLNAINPSRYNHDAFVYRIHAITGALMYSKTYDLQGDNTSKEYGMSIKVKDTLVVVAGYQKGKIMNPNNGSYDAVFFGTNYQGDPLQLRIYGDENTDILTDFFENNMQDGATAVGFSDSWIQPYGSANYSPYVVEAYRTFTEECHDKILPLNTANYTLAVENISLVSMTPSYHGHTLVTPALRVERDVKCKKELDITGSKTMRMAQDDIEEEIVIYPSITSDVLYVEGVNEASDYRVYSVSGQLVLQGRFDANEVNELSVNNLMKGVYLIQIANGNEHTTTRFIKQ